MKLFIFPVTISILALIAVWLWGGVGAFFLATILAILEVTLSFDNAVVNAKILQDMTPVWQRRFLTWGILVSVFGTRLVLPIIIVSVVALTSPVTITALALYNPEEYTRLLTSAEAAIKAFGGTFLLMVSLKYFFNVGKTIHWFAPIERHLVKWGRVEALEVTIALLTLLVVSFLSHDHPETVISAGIIGIIIFTLTEGIAHGLSVETKGMVRSGAMLFAYLNVLDSAFSLDGVIGAFALTTSLPIIVVGLGIGAYFVRSLTVYLVRQGTLQALPYLEHGAHWAVFGLALTMLVGLVVHVPEIIVATIGLGFITLAYISSRRAKGSYRVSLE
ncbi:MAG TPA: DUF475 domain-containing protein [Candidatus Paceibacterota bacterium]|nr:DUF475 domain-containing protein [Candidatus Paceibacterota bacterium]